MRILTKFDIRNNNIVKGINYEGVEKIGLYNDIYNKVNKYIYNELGKEFEIILNDITASLYNIKSGEKDIDSILKNKSFSLPHICSGGINSINEVKKKLRMGCDRIMINTALHENDDLISEIITSYGSQILIPSIETRFINGDYYVYKKYGREETGIKLINWIDKLKKYGVIEILIISMDNDGTLKGYDHLLLNYLKKLNIFSDGTMNCLYAGGIKNIEEIHEIEKSYSFIKGISISTLFYRKIDDLYFLSYLEGNTISVQQYFSHKRHCIIVNSISQVPINKTLCITGHYNTYKQAISLKKNKDFEILKERLLNQTIKYIGICSGLQILVKYIKDENDEEKNEEGLNILPYELCKCDHPNIGFIDGKFYCHSYETVDSSGNRINEYKKDNIHAYQYHPENSII